MLTIAFRVAAFNEAVWFALANAFSNPGQPSVRRWLPQQFEAANKLIDYLDRLLADPPPHTAEELAHLFSFGVPEAPRAAEPRIMEFVKNLPEHEARLKRKHPIWFRVNFLML